LHKFAVLQLIKSLSMDKQIKLVPHFSLKFFTTLRIHHQHPLINLIYQNLMNLTLLVSSFLLPFHPQIIEQTKVICVKFVQNLFLVR